MASKFFYIVYEDGVLWVDGVKKKAGAQRDYFVRVIEDKAGQGVNARGHFEVCDGEPHFYPNRESWRIAE